MGETMMIIIEGMGNHSQDMEGGSEMDVMGYQTQNFHICPSALEAFSSMVKEGYRDDKADMVRNIAMLVDEYLGIEIQAKESGPSPELISSMVDKGNSAMFHLGVLANTVGDESIIQLFNFMPTHVIEAIGMKSEDPMSMEDVGGMGDMVSMSMEDMGGDCGC